MQWTHSVAAIAMVLVACSERGTSTPRTIVRDSAGVTIVESTTGAWDSTSAWTLGPQPLLRIGAVESSDPATLLSRVEGATRLSDGRVVILEGQTSEVRWFASDGTHLATKGGRGKGPGEFTATTALVPIGGDTVLVRDAPRVKHVLYGPDAELLGEEFIDYGRYRAHGRWLECMNLTLPDRSLLGCQPEPGLPASASNRPGRLRTFGRYVLVPWSLDTAHHLGLYGGIEQWGVENDRGRISYAVHPYHARTAVAAGGNPLRVAIALNPEYSIEVWGVNGVLDHVVRRLGARKVASAEQLESALEQMKFFAFGDEALFNRMVSEMEIPDSIPAIGSLIFGPEGDLWVGRPGASAENMNQYDVFNADGEFLGEVFVPGGLIVREVGEDYVLGMRRNDDDVPVVELYALDRRK